MSKNYDENQYKKHRDRIKKSIKKEKHLKELIEMISNYSVELALMDINHRGTRVLDLNKLTSKHFNDIEKKDFPEKLKTHFIETIWKIHNDKFNLIIEEIEGELPENRTK